MEDITVPLLVLRGVLTHLFPRDRIQPVESRFQEQFKTYTEFTQADLVLRASVLPTK